LLKSVIDLIFLRGMVQCLKLIQPAEVCRADKHLPHVIRSCATCAVDGLGPAWTNGGSVRIEIVSVQDSGIAQVVSRVLKRSFPTRSSHSFHALPRPLLSAALQISCSVVVDGSGISPSNGVRKKIRSRAASACSRPLGVFQRFDGPRIGLRPSRVVDRKPPASWAWLSAVSGSSCNIVTKTGWIFNVRRGRIGCGHLRHFSTGSANPTLSTPGPHSENVSIFIPQAGNERLLVETKQNTS